MKRLYFLSTFLVASFFTSAQHSSIAYKKLADSLYQNHSYQNAAIYYEKAIKKSTEPGVVMLQIAKSYSHLNKPKEAEHWFEEARNHHAHLSDAEMYLYIRALLSLEKRQQAEDELLVILEDNPNDVFARQTLDDLRNFQKYYKDSLSSRVTNLPINTPAAEFGAVYYKDGIVFSSAQTEDFIKKKYHWDNSYFLNLYYSPKVNGTFQKPVVFNKKLDSDFHDGPASFYDGGEKMIINRNELHKDPKNKKASYWYLALYDAQQNAAKEWQLTLLPFNEPPSSLAHPAVSPDGNTLYFVSDKTGGYGGTDIYRAERKDGIWSKPFNLGPTVNTFGDESFPFFINNTLYFASNGHGGLGGLDIFKSEKARNGFTTPVNLGFPINSNFDDFALVISDDGETGYFSSARTGNDDLFSFQKKPEVITLMAHIYDGQTKESLQDATVQLITDTGNDLILNSDGDGLIKFELPKKASYVLIGSKDEKSGLQSGVALNEEDHLHIVHPIPAFGDTTKIACIGLIKTESGTPPSSAKVTVLDRRTGKKIIYDQEHPMVSFMGEKGHSYRIEIQNERGDTTVHEIDIKANDTAAKTWTMVLKESTSGIDLAARVFNEADRSALPNTDIKIITFTEADEQKSTNDLGVVDFSLPDGAAYMVLASKDGLTGMHSGIATKDTDKNAIVHPIPARGGIDQFVPVMTLITNDEGVILKDAKVTVTEQSTGKQILAESANGILSFMGEKGKEYTVTVTHEDYQSASEDIKIPSTTSEAEKMSIALKKKQTDQPSSLYLAAKTLKKENDQIIPGTLVKVSSFTEEDLELQSNEQGIANFSMMSGTPFILIANKDGYTGMLGITADESTNSNAIVHSVLMVTDDGKHLPVMVQIKDKQGNTLERATATVSLDSSHQQLPVAVTQGIISFFGEKGKDHTLTVNHNDFQPISKSIHIPAADTEIKKITIVLDSVNFAIPKPTVKNTNVLPISATIANTQGIAIKDATVLVIEKYTNKPVISSFKEGTLLFEGEKGKEYAITVQHKKYESVEEKIAIPLEATAVEKTTFTLQETKPLPKNAAPVIARIANSDGSTLTDASVTVVEKSTGKIIPSTVKDGDLTFVGQKGKEYIITAEHKDYQSGMKKIVVPVQTKSSAKVQLTLVKKVAPTPVVATITDKQGNLLSDANVTVTETSSGRTIPAKFTNGTLQFDGEKGKVYTVAVNHDNYLPGSKQFTVPTNTSQTGNTTIALEEKPSPLSAVLTDKNGNTVTDATVTVTEKRTGKKVAANITNGTVNFAATKGNEYVIAVEHKNYRPATTTIVVPADVSTQEKTTITLEEKVSPTSVVTAAITDKNGNVVNNATVTVIETNTGKTIEGKIANGVLTFDGTKGNEYTITVDHTNYKTTTSNLVVPIDSTEKDKTTITLEAKSSVTNIVITVTDKNGNMVNDATVTVTESSTGKVIESEFKNGVLTFDGEKGKEYAINVNSQNYKSANTTFTVPTNTSNEEKLNITLEEKSTTIVPVTMVVSDKSGRALTTASVTVTESGSGKIIPAKFTNGELQFDGEKGKDYTITVNHSDYKTATKQLTIPATLSEPEKPTIVLEEKNKSLPVAILITDSKGKSLKDASITVINNETGKQIQANVINGTVSFNGERGATYAIIVKHKDYDPATKKINIPENTTNLEKITIALTKRESKQAPVIMAVHVFKADNQQPLVNADVKITSFSEPDIDLKTNENGVVEFSLPTTTPYILIANKDGYTGMHSGTAEPDMSKASITHEVPAFNDPEKQVPVIGLATDEDGNMIADIQVIIVNEATGERLPAKVDNGFISFLGKNGNSYTVETTATGYKSQTSRIMLDPSDPNSHKLVINLVSKNKKLPVDSHLIIVKNDDQTSRYYISTAEAHYEITEENGILYLENDTEKKSLGKGSLADANAKADSLIAAYGLSSTETVTIGNVYFDHNKAQLDDADKHELEKIKDLMVRYPALKLNIGAHADDRGSDNYNLNLSKKRAHAIAIYLARHTISRDRILENFYGESLPAAPCVTIECTEDERQKNRRAEFAFRSTKTKQQPVVAITPAKTIEKKLPKQNTDEYLNMIELYGDRKLDSLSFKISIGAYRYNSTLTFENLKDLGTVEVIFSDGITYYYLSEYETLRDMEKVRQQVIKRGVKDASFIILHKGVKIPFSTFLSLTQ